MAASRSALSYQPSYPPRLLRPIHRTTRGPRPPRPADGFVRLAAGQRALADPGGGRAEGRRQGHPGAVRPRGDLRGDQPDRGLHGNHVAVVPRPPVRAAQVLRGGVQGQGHDVLRPHVRDGGVHQQQHRRDQEPDRLHGRLPAHDRPRAPSSSTAPSGSWSPSWSARPASTSTARSDKTSDKDIYSCKVIPSRGAWLEFEIDKRDSVGVRIDRKRKQSVTVLLKALGWDEAQDPGAVRRATSRCGPPWRRTTRPARTTRCSTSTASCGRASRRPGSPPRRCWRTSTSTPKRYDLAKVGRYKINKKLGLGMPIRQGTLTEEDIVATIEYLVRLHAGEEDMKAGDAIDPGRDRRHRPLRQPAAAHGRRADPEPGPARPGPDGARGQGADDHPGRRGDHAADPDQHPAGRRVHQGVLRHQPARPSSWTRPTRWPA